jgi:uncharacterized protein (TIGR02246 family)
MAEARSQEPDPIGSLYHELLACWNRRSATDFAGLFEADGNVVGFDGSPNNGQPEIETTLGGIFRDHVTAAYVGKIREVRFLTSDVAVLRAVAGMIPPSESDLNPAVNAVQTLVAARRGGRWRIAVFQNTPAAFHGRPELSAQLTEELRQVSGP